MAEECRSLLEKEIRINGEIIIKASGNSMRPFIRPNEDILIIEKVGDSIVKNDIVLFYHDDKVVLHRVIAVHSDSIDTRGDNSVRAEKGINKSDIFGKLTRVKRDGREIDVNSKSCRAAALLWYYMFPFRCAVKIPRKIITLFK